MNNYENGLIRDLGIVILSIFVAVIFAKTGVLEKILTSTKELEILGSFVAGMFFTSVFTTAPAIVTLGEIAHANSVILTAVFGGLGAVVGDLVIFRFIRDRLSVHLVELITHQGMGKRFKVLLKMRYFRWSTFLLGGIIIASPLPDELGISILGFSKVRISWFVPVSFVFNFIGILIIGFVSKAI